MEEDEREKAFMSMIPMLAQIVEGYYDKKKEIAMRE
jgi:hypothetical protein